MFYHTLVLSQEDIWTNKNPLRSKLLESFSVHKSFFFLYNSSGYFCLPKYHRAILLTFPNKQTNIWKRKLRAKIKCNRKKRKMTLVFGWIIALHTQPYVNKCRKGDEETNSVSFDFGYWTLMWAIYNESPEKLYLCLF